MTRYYRKNKCFLSIISLIFLLQGCNKEDVFSSEQSIQIKENQKCKHVTLTTQSQINEFDCTRITGDLNIIFKLFESDVTDLFPLRTLNKIDGDLNIYFEIPYERPDEKIYYVLNDLKGLHNLKTVGGNVSINNNFRLSLNNLDGLTGLTDVGGSLLISGSDSVDDDVEFRDLPNLEYVGKDLALLNFRSTDITGLNKLRIVGGNFRITGGPQKYVYLNTVSGFDELRTVLGNITFYGIAQIEGFNKLENIGDVINFIGTPYDDGDYHINPLKISGFNGLKDIDKISFQNVESLDGFLHANSLYELIVKEVAPDCSDLCIFFDKSEEYDFSGSSGCTSLRDYVSTCKAE